MALSDVISAARGEVPADLLLANARMVNVFSGEILQGNIAVAGGRIAGIGDYPAQEVVDLEGRIVAPGFIDAHLHIESAMVTVSEFAKAVLPRGTTTVVADPHEIANVAGAAGIRYMLASAEAQPLNVYYTLPSCVPATDLETAGARLSARDLADFMGHERVVALAEMMNFPGVIYRDPEVLAKIELAARHRKPVDGHAPALSGRDLNAYVASGVSSDHECTSFREALEKLRCGMHIMIREGTAARNLDDLLPLVSQGGSERMMWCTDDRHPHDLMEKGHVDHILRRAIGAGVDPVTAIRMATIHPARYFGLSHRIGAIAPGLRADLVVLSDLNALRIDAVYAGGRLAARDGELVPETVFPQAPAGPPAMAAGIGNLDFKIQAEGSRIRVIEVQPDQIITAAGIENALIRGDEVVADPDLDLLKICVVECHLGTGNVGKAFVRGFGLKAGAIASSVAHDSHNLILVGTSDADMVTAAERVIRMGGGLAVSCDGRILADLALPVAGLMSDAPLAVVRERLDGLIESARSLGCPLSDPFMSLSFLALPVIPELKITDRGLVDVAAFRQVPLFV
jgi:adenine deaminase